MKPKSNSVYLDHMLQAFSDATEFVRGQTFESFRANKLVSYATIRALLIVGEACKSVDSAVRDRFPEIPWRLMAGTRDRLVHDYFDTKWQIVWNVATAEIPNLTEPLKRVRDQLESEEAQQQTGTPE